MLPMGGIPGSSDINLLSAPHGECSENVLSVITADNGQHWREYRQKVKVARFEGRGSSWLGVGHVGTSGWPCHVT